MPTRLIHEELLESPSILRCSPRAQDAFPRLILVADNFGCFVADPDKVKALAWLKRPDVTPADVAGWFREWSRAEMLFLWNQGGRCYGFLTGWFGARGQRWWVEYRGKAEGGRGRELKGSKRKTPRPPGWLGLRETPWSAPGDWVPGEVWMGFAAEAIDPAQDAGTLSLFAPALPVRETPRISLPTVSDPGAVADAGAAPRARAREAALGPSGAVPAVDLPRAVERRPGAVPVCSQGADPGTPGAVQATAVPSASTCSDAVPSEAPGAVLGELSYLRRPAELERPPPRAAPLAGQFWPKTEQLRRALSDALGGQQNSGRGLRTLDGSKADRDAFEQALGQVGVDVAVAACVERAIGQGKGAGIRSLAYFVGVVQDLAAPPVAKTSGMIPVSVARPKSAVATPADRTRFRGGERAL